MNALPQYKTEPIAIVGSSCRFPGGATSTSKLWDLLREPRDLLREIPSDRFNPNGFYHPNGEHHGSANVKHSYFMNEDPRVFDHSFFQIHPKEAESMDPQQRILLETVYEGIESAGYSIPQLKGSSTAVFVGQMNNDYYNLLIRDVDSAPQYFATGATLSIMSNRVSYFFDWKGPSVTMDTACSSSMVALHQAVQALRSGEAGMAVAAGVNLILGPEMYIFESKLHMLSPTGRSRMWDSDVDGYARGEGFAAVILKPLSKAIADGDHIESIIRETGVNQDGRTKGITMPSSSAQATLMRSVYARCGLDLSKSEDRPQFFEAHGTGTPAGDPIEAEAIQSVFFPGGKNQHGSKLYVGSIKTVIGHLEGAAGLAGLIKASLAMQHGFIPPNMHFNNLNPKIAPFYTHLEVPTQLTSWPTSIGIPPRRASVNSFGFGGTNSHVILESWPSNNDGTQPLAAADSHIGPFVLSAHSAESLNAAATALSTHIETSKNIRLSNIGYTLTKRGEFPWKAAVAASTREGLIKELSTISPTRALPVSAALPPRILGIFTGQGAQWATMGSKLYASCGLFRTSIQDQEEALRTLPDGPKWSIIEQLLAPEGESRIHEALISQPLCTALQVALIDLLRACGVSFSAVVGHSSGEIAAAYAAGYLKAKDAVRIAYYRGVHAPLAVDQNGNRGKMMAVGLQFDEAISFCENDLAGRIGVAASNSRTSTTLSGDADAIDQAP